jgi:hypothetical protein
VRSPLRCPCPSFVGTALLRLPCTEPNFRASYFAAALPNNGCLLKEQRVIQTERSQSRPAETFRAPLRQKAVTTNAEQRAAPSALSTERLKSDTGSIAISTNAHFSTGLTLIAYAVTAVKAARPNSRMRSTKSGTSSLSKRPITAAGMYGRYAIGVYPSVPAKGAKIAGWSESSCDVEYVPSTAARIGKVRNRSR